MKKRMLCYKLRGHTVVISIESFNYRQSRQPVGWGHSSRVFPKSEFSTVVMSADFWAGYVSGAAGILVGNPLDIVKVRLQVGESTAISTVVPPASLQGRVSSLVRGAFSKIRKYTVYALMWMSKRCDSSGSRLWSP